MSLLLLEPAPSTVPSPSPVPAPPPSNAELPDGTPVWVGSHNFRPHRPYPPIALVIHTMGGTLAGTDRWFQDPASSVSAHFGAGDRGELHQYVLVRDTAYGNGIKEPGNRWAEVCQRAGRPELAAENPNGVTVSVETEDFGIGTHPVSEDEYAATLTAGRLALAQAPTILVLTAHHVISPQTRPYCPGTRWTEGRIQQLAQDLVLDLVI